MTATRGHTASNFVAGDRGHNFMATTPLGHGMGRGHEIEFAATPGGASVGDSGTRSGKMIG